MTLSISPFDSPIGAEVTGIELRHALDKSMVETIYQVPFESNMVQAYFSL